VKFTVPSGKYGSILLDPQQGVFSSAAVMNIERLPVELRTETHASLC
jgi:hypothetical protein